MMIHDQVYFDKKKLVQQELQIVGQWKFKSVYHRSIGSLIMLDRCNKKIYSTGVLLSKNIVLTAASSIYNQQQNYLYQNIKFYLPEKGLGKKYYEIENIRYPPQYQSGVGNKLQFDYALLKLKNQVIYDQFPQISFPCYKCIANTNNQEDVSIYGFPCYKNNFTPINQEEGFEFVLKQYGICKKKVIYYAGPNKFKISYSVNKLPHGHSGSPIMMENKIIGIHIGAIKYSNIYNIGRLVDQQFFQNIIKMCDQMKGDFFKIIYKQACPHQQTKLQKTWNDFINGQSLSFKKKILPMSSISLKQQMNDIILLDLTSQQKFKLTEKDMLAFSKVKLPYLTDIKLNNNRIRDEGLQILCGNMYPQLKKVSLDDNAITINGLKSILFNKWNEDVQYYLHSVQSNEGQYYLHVGESLPIMKKMLGNKNMNEVDSLIPLETSKTLNSMNLLLATPLDIQDPKKMAFNSQKLQQGFRYQSQQNPYSIATVLLQLKNYLGNSINFCEKSSIQSKLSSKIIFTGLLDQRVRFTKKFQKFKNYHFSDFRCNSRRLIEFEAELMESLREEYKIVTKDMSLDKITEGCIVVTISDSVQNAYSNNRSFMQNVTDEVRIYFQNLRLTQDQFDSKGNYNFPEIQIAELQIRGGLPYYQPVLGKRFGIKVQNLYDNGNNDWLMMDGNKDQWAIAFHGVKYPTQQNRMRSIMNGRIEGKMLCPGFAQACKENDCLKNGSIVGEGIYVSPYFLVSLFDYSQINENQKYHLVLQCRVKPQSIKIPRHKADYWVINNPNQLRPYGIILYTDQDIRKLKETRTQNFTSSPQHIHKIIYNQEFTPQTWANKYKKQYEAFIASK